MTSLFVIKNNVQLPAGQLQQLSGRLPTLMQAKAARFYYWQQRQAYILSKLLLQFSLGQYNKNLCLKQVQYTCFGRPYINAGIDFNLSHSGDYIVCVVSDECRVGIDIERMQQLDITCYKQQFNNDEWTQVAAACKQGRNDLFYNYWTLKEASVKADGRAMSLPLNQVAIYSNHIAIGSRRWFFMQYTIVGGYATHLVSSVKIQRPVVQWLTSDDLNVNANDLNVNVPVYDGAAC